MNKWVLIGLVCVVAWLQVYLLARLSGGLWLVNIVLILVVIACLQRSFWEAMAVGLVAGFWLDSASFTQFGIRMLFMAGLVLAVMSLVRSGLSLEKRWLYVFIVAAASLLYGLWLLLWAWIDIGVVWSARLLGLWLVEAFAVAALAWLAYKPLSRLTQRPRYA